MMDAITAGPAEPLNPPLIAILAHHERNITNA